MLNGRSLCPCGVRFDEFTSEAGFNSIGGQTRNSIAALDAPTGVATAWNPNAGGGNYGGYCRCLCPYAVLGSTVYAGGKFHKHRRAEPRYCIAALDTSDRRRHGLESERKSAMMAILPISIRLAVSGSTVYTGGGFHKYWRAGAQQDRRSWMPRRVLATAWNPNANGGYGYVSALADIGFESLYAGGNVHAHRRPGCVNISPR